MRGLIDDLACTRSQRNKLTAQLDQAVRAGRRGQTSKAIRELCDLKDLVRRILLASWTATPDPTEGRLRGGTRER